MCAVGVVLGRVQNQARVQGHSDALTRTVRTCIEVPAQPLSGLTERTSDFITSMSRAGDLEAEVRRLRQMEIIAATYAETVRSLRQEIDDLHKMADMPEAVGKIKIRARVIGYYPLENRLTINVGSAQKVIPGLPVVTGDGLVGVVQTADADSSQVQLLSSPRPFQIGAKVQRDPPAIGLLHGEASDRLAIEFTDLNSPVQVNDTVVTSGLSALIPPDIAIGKIVQVYSDAEFGTRNAQVYPAVSIGRVREVIVLR